MKLKFIDMENKNLWIMWIKPLITVKKVFFIGDSLWKSRYFIHKMWKSTFNAYFFNKVLR